MDIQISQFATKDKRACFNLIERVVIDGFLEENIDIKKEKTHLDSELDIQRNRIQQIPGNYVIAKDGTSVVGMIAHAQPSEAVELAAKKLNVSIASIREIISLYVHPDYQRRGIGSLLFTYITTLLQHKKIEYVSVCTGYRKGRSFWTKKLGQASVIFPTYYSGHPCSVWIRKIRDIL